MPLESQEPEETEMEEEEDVRCMEVVRSVFSEADARLLVWHYLASLRGACLPDTASVVFRLAQLDPETGTVSLYCYVDCYMLSYNKSVTATNS